MVGLQDSFRFSTRSILLAIGVALWLTPPSVLADQSDAASDESSAASDEGGAATDEDSVASDPAVAAIDAFIAKQNVDKSQAGWKERVKRPPTVSFSLDKAYFWNLETNKGKIKIKLMPKIAPNHVGSTIYLTRMGFYDDIKFHRVITGFMAQGGDPTGTGRGGPGYRYAGEFDSNVRHDKPGILSMANAGPETDGSQFFITFTRTPCLNDKHTIFGEVVQGMTTVKRLEQAGSRQGKPTKKLVIERATISVQ